MKVERINNSKAKITLTFKELEKRKISLNDIKNNKIKAQDFFLELLEDANLLEEFETDSNELFIEAGKENNKLIITVTKMCTLDSSEIIPKENTLYKISSNIYVFDNLDTIKTLIDFALKSNLYLPECKLYSFNNKFFLMFNKKDVKTSSFVKTFSLLSEFAKSYSASSSVLDIVTEYGTLLVKSCNANQILEYPYFLT